SASIGRETFRGSTRLENSPLCLALDRACPGSQSPSKVVSRDLPAAQAGKFPPVLFVLRWALENRRISRTDGMDPARLYTASGWAQDVLSNIRTKRGGSEMEVTTIGIDLAKSVFAVSGADSSGRVVMRRQLRRAQVLGFMRGLPRCVVEMEATGGAHYWARQLSALGHEVRVMSPALVMPYRKGNKTDRNDADAILEAVTRPSMRFVAVKSVAQQDLLALHRVRAQLVKSRTALCNQLRGLLRERGVAVRTGAAALKRSLPAALADESSELSGEMRELLSEMSQWLRTLEQRIASCEARITRKFKHDERCQRLAEVPGVGQLTATALVAAVGNAQRFRNGQIGRASCRE